MNTSPINNFITADIGSPIHLDQAKKLCLSDQKVANLMKNLTTNEPSLVSLKDYKIEPLPHASLQENAYLLYLHAKYNINLHLNAIGSAAVITAFCAFTVFTVITVREQLAQLYDDIVNERLVYVEFPHEIVGMAYYYGSVVRAILAIAYITIIEFIVGATLYRHIVKLKESLIDFFANPNQLIIEVEKKDSSFSISDQTNLANNFDEETDSFLDPFSINNIKKEWIHAPRFIKIGSYLFPIDSLFKKIFFTKEDKLIRHPVENRPLTTQEQDTLLADLSSLFQIDKNKMIECWDPYLDENDRKNAAKRNLDFIADRSESNVKAAVEDQLLSDDLKSMIRDWESFDCIQKIFIMKQIKQDLFASKKLKNFLQKLPREILKLQIQNTPEDSFTLQSLLNEELNRSFEYQKPINPARINFGTIFAVPEIRISGGEDRNALLLHNQMRILRNRMTSSP